MTRRAKKHLLRTILFTTIFTIYPLSLIHALDEIDSQTGKFRNLQIKESQRIRFIPDKAPGTPWTKDTIGDSDHDGFIISLKKEENQDFLTLVCLNMMAFTTRKHTYKIPDVDDENGITPLEAQDYKNRLDRIAQVLARSIKTKNNVVLVLQEMRQSNLKSGKFMGDNHKDSNTEFRDFFIDSFKKHSGRNVDSFSKPTITNTFSNMILVEDHLQNVNLLKDRLPEFDSLKTGEATERANLIESGHAILPEGIPQDQNHKGIKTQKDRALGVEINGIEIYGVHLIHQKNDMPTDYDSDLRIALSNILNRKRNENKPIVLIGDFNFDLSSILLSDALDLKIGYIHNGALDGKEGKESIDGYIASSQLIIC